MSNKLEALQVLGYLRDTYFGAVCSGILQKMDEHDLTFVQRNVLIFIANHPGCIFSDVSKNFCLKNPSMTRIMYSLEDKSLVVRSKGGDDMRKRFVHVTEKGRKTALLLNNVPLKRIGKMLGKLSSSEHKTMAEGFEVLLKGYKSITKK